MVDFDVGAVEDLGPKLVAFADAVGSLAIDAVSEFIAVNEEILKSDLVTTLPEATAITMSLRTAQAALVAIEALSAAVKEIYGLALVDFSSQS